MRPPSAGRSLRGRRGTGRRLRQRGGLERGARCRGGRRPRGLAWGCECPSAPARNVRRVFSGFDVGECSWQTYTVENAAILQILEPAGIDIGPTGTSKDRSNYECNHFRNNQNIIGPFILKNIVALSCWGLGRILHIYPTFVNLYFLISI